VLGAEGGGLAQGWACTLSLLYSFFSIMDNNSSFNLDMLETDNLDFLKKLLLNSNDDNSDFLNFDSDFEASPYADNVSSSTYVDESEFCIKFKANFNDSILSVLSLNVQSINAKFNSLAEFIFLLSKNSCSHDVICLQELWQFPDNVSFNLPGYHPMYFKLRRQCQGGGVGIFVKENFKYTSLVEKSHI
jgi:hypothetical protein